MAAKKSNAKKGAERRENVIIPITPGVVAVRSMEEAISYLEEMEAITEAIAPLLRHQVDIKKVVTQYGVRKKVAVFQCDGLYFRQVNRANRFWASTDDDLPNPRPKGARSLKAIMSGKTVKVKGVKKSLWNLVTRRVVDQEKLNDAVSKGWITEKEIEKAYIEKSQAPFYQRFQGEADS